MGTREDEPAAYPGKSAVWAGQPALLYTLIILAGIAFFLPGANLRTGELLRLHAPLQPRGPGSFAILSHGFAHGWEAGAPLVPLSVRTFVVEPLISAGFSVSVYFCLDKELSNVTVREILSWGVNITHFFVFDAMKFARRKACYERALEERGAQPTWWLATRTDLVYFSQIKISTDNASATVYSRVRMAHGFSGLTTDSFSWLYGDGDRLCVDSCEPPCRTFTHPFLVADDQFAVIPGDLAATFFAPDLDSATTRSTAIDLAPCAGVTSPPGTYRSFAELQYTCILMDAGIRFSPIEVAARVNPHSRAVTDWFVPMRLPISPPISKDCS